MILSFLMSLSICLASGCKSFVWKINLRKQLIYHTSDGQCYEPLTQGPCQEGQWLVANDGAILECVENTCGPNKILIDSVCRHIADESLCPRLGEGIFANAKGEPSCECWDGWVRRETQNSLNMMDNINPCYQLFTTGFCQGNQIVAVSFGTPVCIDNPCGHIFESFPHQ